jgi:hypothetical protein
MGALINVASSVITSGTIPTALVDGTLVSTSVLQTPRAVAQAKSFLDSVESRFSMLDSGG